MLEIAENGIQLVFTAICTIISAWHAARTGRHAWAMLGLSSFVYFLGDLYWQMFMIFYGKAPYFSYIPWLCYYACYVFLLLLLFEIRGSRPLVSSIKRFWVVPVFTFGMCAFYIKWGDYTSNIIAAVIMWLLIWTAAEGLFSVHKRMGDDRKNRSVYIMVLIFCAVEYATWTSSCFWVGNTILNPYFWFEFLLSVTFLIFPPALRKAVEA